MQTVFGTGSFTGLNVAAGPHLIADHELQESYNGWTDQDGVWRSARGPEVRYSGYTTISALAAGRMGGADHVVWLDDGTLYDNGADVGSLTEGDSMDIVATDDGFLILGAAKNWIWDGTHLREQGAPQVTLPSQFLVGISSATQVGYNAAITGITNASSAVVSTTLAVSVGERVLITGVAGMVELNGNTYEVTATNPGVSLTIDVDSTSFGSYSSGGTAYDKAAGLVGDYQFYVTQTVELADGRVLEGKPKGLRQKNKSLTFTAIEAVDTDVITLAETDIVTVTGNMFWGLSGTDFYEIGGTLGTDYLPGMRLYRTKANGYDYYLVDEWTHGDADFTYTAGVSPYHTIDTHYSYLPDNELGAVYLPGNFDHDSAPQSDYAAQVGQRVYLASGQNVYWSHFDGIEYYNQSTGFERFPDIVTALATFRNYAVVFSADRMWLMEIATDGLPNITEIPTPVGTTYSKAITTTDDGVLFLREDGLWLFNGARVQQIALQAFDSITSPTSVASAGNLLFVSGSEKSYVAIARGGSATWHESEHYMPYADATSGKIYASNGYYVYEMFVGRRAGGRLRTKAFGNTAQHKTVRIVVDMEGSTAPTVWVNGNIQSDYDGHMDPTNPGDGSRRVVRYSVPRLNNQWVDVRLDTTGDVKVYGMWCEVAR